jgi:hypothetical protein
MDVLLGFTAAVPQAVRDFSAASGRIQPTAGNFPQEGLRLSAEGPQIDLAGDSLFGANQASPALALPAALPLDAFAAYPVFLHASGGHEGRGILILALPRSAAGESALDNFMKKRDPQKAVDLFFLYEDSSFEETARSCAALYGQKPNVSSRSILCQPPDPERTYS